MPRLRVWKEKICGVRTSYYWDGHLFIEVVLGRLGLLLVGLLSVSLLLVCIPLVGCLMVVLLLLALLPVGLLLVGFLVVTFEATEVVSY